MRTPAGKPNRHPHPARRKAGTCPDYTLWARSFRCRIQSQESNARHRLGSWHCCPDQSLQPRLQRASARIRHAGRRNREHSQQWAPIDRKSHNIAPPGTAHTWTHRQPTLHPKKFQRDMVARWVPRLGSMFRFDMAGCQERLGVLGRTNWLTPKGRKTLRCNCPWESLAQHHHKTGQRGSQDNRLLHRILQKGHTSR